MTKTRKFVITDHLKDSRSIVGYLDACLEEGGQPLFLKALGEVIKAVGITKVTQAAGIASRTSAYRSFSPDGNPGIVTVDSVLDALGMRLSVVAKDQEHGHGHA